MATGSARVVAISKRATLHCAATEGLSKRACRDPWQRRRGAAVVTDHRLAGPLVEALEVVAPALFAELAQQAVGVDEPHHQQGCKRPVAPRCGGGAGQELLDAVGKPVDVAAPGEVVAPLELDVARLGPRVGQRGVGGEDIAAAPKVEHRDGWRQGLGRRGEGEPIEHGACLAGARAQPLETRPPRLEPGIERLVGREQGRGIAASPNAADRADQLRHARGRRRGILDERPRARRKAGGEGEGGAGAIERAEQGKAAAAGGVGHCPKVVDGQRPGVAAVVKPPLAEAGAARLDQDQAGEPAQPLDELTKAGILPLDLEV